MRLTAGEGRSASGSYTASCVLQAASVLSMHRCFLSEEYLLGLAGKGGCMSRLAACQVSIPATRSRTCPSFWLPGSAFLTTYSIRQLVCNTPCARVALLVDRCQVVKHSRSIVAAAMCVPGEASGHARHAQSESSVLVET